ncbi:MAG: hypothetical protein AAGF97_13290, partial [Planctomycetota bacterium]
LGIAALFGMVILFGRDAASYVGTSAGMIKDTVKDSVPTEFQIERARKMIAALDPEIRKNMHVIAREEVEVERLAKQIERLETRVAKGQDDLQKLTADLSSGKTVFHYAGRRYNENQVRIDLASRLHRVKKHDETLVSLSKTLNARENSLSAARQKLEEMLASKRNLLVEVENLEARRRLVEVGKAAGEFHTGFDDSRLARTQELIDEIRTRIEVDERMVDVEFDFNDEIPLDQEDTVDEDIVEQVMAYLGNGVHTVVTVAEAD